MVSVSKDKSQETLATLSLDMSQYGSIHSSKVISVKQKTKFPLHTAVTHIRMLRWHRKGCTGPIGPHPSRLVIEEMRPARSRNDPFSPVPIIHSILECPESIIWGHHLNFSMAAAYS